MFKLGMHVEENILEKTDTTHVCMTSDFSIGEQEAMRQYKKIPACQFIKTPKYLLPKAVTTILNIYT